MNRFRTILPWLAAALVLAVPLSAAQPASAATLTGSRTCADFVTGDGYRRLSVCARGYIDGTSTRAVVEMHTYARVPGYDGWYDSRSQSITLDAAELYPSLIDFGTQRGSCRINGAGGSVGCSVSNATRVAFYSPTFSRRPNLPATMYVRHVSWRDDRGIAHRVYEGSGSAPDTLPITYSWW